MRQSWGVLGLAVLAMSCASAPTLEEGPASARTLKAMPNWYKKPPASDNKYVYAPATATSQDLQVAVNKAQVEGRSVLAAQLEVKLGALTTRATEEAGVLGDATLRDAYSQITKAAVASVLVGTRAKEQQFAIEAGQYRVWVLMELPFPVAGKRFLDQLKSQEQLFERIRNTESVKALYEDVMKYEGTGGVRKP